MVIVGRVRDIAVDRDVVTSFVHKPLPRGRGNKNLPPRVVRERRRRAVIIDKDEIRKGKAFFVPSPLFSSPTRFSPYLQEILNFSLDLAVFSLFGG